MPAVSLGSGAQLKCANTPSGSQKPVLEQRQHDSWGLVRYGRACSLGIHTPNSRVPNISTLLWIVPNKIGKIGHNYPPSGMTCRVSPLLLAACSRAAWVDQWVRQSNEKLCSTSLSCLFGGPVQKQRQSCMRLVCPKGESQQLKHVFLLIVNAEIVVQAKQTWPQT